MPVPADVHHLINLPAGQAEKWCRENGHWDETCVANPAGKWRAKLRFTVETIDGSFIYYGSEGEKVNRRVLEDLLEDETIDWDFSIDDDSVSDIEINSYNKLKGTNQYLVEVSGSPDEDLIFEGTFEFEMSVEDVEDGETPHDVLDNVIDFARIVWKEPNCPDYRAFVADYLEGGNFDVMDFARVGEP